jgi:hypothetical protein
MVRRMTVMGTGAAALRSRRNSLDSRSPTALSTPVAGDDALFPREPGQKSHGRLRCRPRVELERTYGSHAHSYKRLRNGRARSVNSLHSQIAA